MAEAGIDSKVLDTPRQGPATRPAAMNLNVTFDADTGNLSVPGAGVDATSHKAAVLTRARERVAAATSGVPHEASQVDARGVPIGTPTPPTMAPLAGAASAAEAPPELEAEPVEADAAAEGEPEVEAEPETPALTEAAYRFELEQARAAAAHAQAQLEAISQGHRPEQFDNYSSDPIGWLKGQLASVLGVAATDPLVDNEASHLFGELTWNSVGLQDVPEQQQAQLRLDRADRRIRLDQHRRQADRKAAQVSEEEQRARSLVQSVYDTVKPQFPAVPLAELRLGKPLPAIIQDRMLRGIREGTIRDWDTKSLPDIVTEALRLIDSETTQWAQQLGPQLAHLTPATAPISPGSSSRPTAAKAPAIATPGKPAAKSRTLPQQKAGAAPSRLVAAPQEEPLPLEPRARAMAIIQRRRT